MDAQLRSTVMEMKTIEAVPFSKVDSLRSEQSGVGGAWCFRVIARYAVSVSVSFALEKALGNVLLGCSKQNVRKYRPTVFF